MRQRCVARIVGSPLEDPKYYRLTKAHTRPDCPYAREIPANEKIEFVGAIPELLRCRWCSKTFAPRNWKNRPKWQFPDGTPIPRRFLDYWDVPFQPFYGKPRSYLHSAPLWVYCEARKIELPYAPCAPARTATPEQTALDGNYIRVVAQVRAEQKALADDFVRELFRHGWTPSKTSEGLAPEALTSTVQ